MPCTVLADRDISVDETKSQYSWVMAFMVSIIEKVKQCDQVSVGEGMGLLFVWVVRKEQNVQVEKSDLTLTTQQDDFGQVT